MIFHKFKLEDINNLKKDDLFNWNGLPAMIIDDEKVAVFTNIDGMLKVIEMTKDELVDAKTIEEAKENHLFDCLNKKIEKKHPTLTLVMSVTERCNNRCRYCFLDANKAGTDMTEEMAFASIDAAMQLAKGKTLNLAYFGGEPTVSFSLMKTSLAYAKSHPKVSELEKLEFTITTNGVFNDHVLQFLIENNFNVSLSMDGIPEVQEYHRPLANGCSNCALVEKNVIALAKSVKLKIRATVTAFSVNKMVESVQWLADRGVKRIHFGPVTPGGRGATANPLLQPPSSEDFVKNLYESIRLGEKLGVDVICFPYMNALYAPMTYCDGRINSRLVITPKGIVSSCVEVQDRDHPLFEAFNLGHYDEMNKKFVLTASERRSAVKMGCEALKMDKTHCQTCPLLFFCGGGCPTRNYRGSGNTEQIDEFRCEITKGIMPYILKRFYHVTYQDSK